MYEYSQASNITALLCAVKGCATTDVSVSVLQCNVALRAMEQWRVIHLEYNIATKLITITIWFVTITFY